MAERYFPWSDPTRPMDFLSVDALAAHLARQRQGRVLDMVPAHASDGADDYDGLSLYALRKVPGEAAPARDPLGFVTGPNSSSTDRLTQALARVTAVGGLAA